MELVKSEETKPSVNPGSEGLDLEEILSANDVRYAQATVPAWGTKPVLLRSLTAGALSEWTRQNQNSDGSRKPLGGCRLVAMSLCNTKGDHVIPEERWQEVAERLATKDSQAVDLVVDEIMKLNGLRVSSDKVKKD